MMPTQAWARCSRACLKLPIKCSKLHKTSTLRLANPATDRAQPSNTTWPSSLPSRVRMPRRRFALHARNPRSIYDPIEREKNLAYGAITAGALSQLWKVVRRARKALPAIEAPTLIIQSREDPRISVEVAESALNRLGASEKRIVWTQGAGHIITVDYGRERVFTETERWLDAHTLRKPTAVGD